MTVNSPETNAEEDVVVTAEDPKAIADPEIRASSCLNRYYEKVRVVDVGFGIPESPYNFSYDDGLPNLDSSHNASQANHTSTPTVVAWKPGQPIVEPNTIKTLPDGRQFFVATKSTAPLEVHLCTRNDPRQK